MIVASTVLVAAGQSPASVDEPRAWVDEHGALRAPEGYCFEFVDAPGFDTSGYPRKVARLVPVVRLVWGYPK